MNGKREDYKQAAKLIELASQHIHPDGSFCCPERVAELKTQALSLLKPKCATCGGSKTIDLACYGGSTKHVIPCPDCPPKPCYIPGYIDATTKRGQKPEPNPTAQAYEKVCNALHKARRIIEQLAEKLHFAEKRIERDKAHIEQLEEENKDLISGHFCPSPQLSKLATICDCAHSDRHRALDWARIERLEAELKGAKDGTKIQKDEG